MQGLLPVNGNSTECCNTSDGVEEESRRKPSQRPLLKKRNDPRKQTRHQHLIYIYAADDADDSMALHLSKDSYFQ